MNMSTKEGLHLMTEIHSKQYPDRMLRFKNMVLLLYLSDKQAQIELGTTITDLEYTKQYAGPYTREIEDALENAHSEHLLHKVTRSGEQYLHLCNCPMHNVEIEYDTDQKEIIESVIQKHGDKSHSDLREYVMNLSEIQNTDKYGIVRLS